MTTRIPFIAALAACGFALSTCGDDEEPTGTTRAARTVTVQSTNATTTPGTTSTSTPPAETTANTVPFAATTTTPAPSSTSEDGLTGTTSSDENGNDADSVAFLRPFSPASPWNTRVDAAAVDPRSDRFMRQAKLRFGVKEGQTLEALTTFQRRINEPVFINTERWTTPVVDSADGGVPTRVACRQANLPPPNNDCGDGAFVKTLNIPPDVNPRPQNDGWFTVIDRSTNSGYDLWRARRSRDRQSMSYQFLRRWDLDGSGFLAPTVVSARGSGLPLFAGLINPEEIRAGRIEHALSIVMPGPASRRYVQPASVTDGQGPQTSIPEGARVRLKADFDIDDALRRRPEGSIGGNRRPGFPGSTNRRAARAIMTALREYGAIVVDRSAVPTLFAKLNFDWEQRLRDSDGNLLGPDGRTRLGREEARRDEAGTPLLRGNEVANIFLDDFEVVRLPPLRLDPPRGLTAGTLSLGQALPQAVPSATSATGTTSTPTTSTSTTPTTTSTTP